MAKHKRDRGMRVGFAWFDRAQWHRLTEVADDRNELDDTFEQWERNALDAVQALERQGQRIEKIYVDIDAFVSWCKSKRLPINSASRAQYIAFVLRQRDRQAKV
jgi:hypothetical protein